MSDIGMVGWPRGGAVLDRIAAWAVHPHPALFRWSLAAALLALATILRAALEPALADGYPFVTFYPAVALAAFVCGTVPAVAVTLSAATLGWLVFMRPVAEHMAAVEVAAALTLFVVASATPTLLLGLLRHAYARLARARSAEAAAREQARARTLMFSELQHRVSNHLGVAGSLLALQRREVAHPEAGRALEDAARRLRVAARLSRLLHDPDAQVVDVGAFLRAMAPDAVSAAGLDGRAQVVVTADALLLPAERAVPLGLVATELLANALEHGTAGGTGRVEVSFREAGNGWARLVVRDDGPGLPAGFDPDAGHSLGLTLARQFAGQLGGRLSFRSDNGAVATLDVPLEGMGAERGAAA